MTSTVSRTVALLAALSLLAHAGRAAPGVLRNLADVKLALAECPVRVQTESYADLVPPSIKTFKCDWDLISAQHLGNCVELQDTAMFFTREKGVRIGRDVSVGCVRVPGGSSEAVTIGGEA